MKLPGIYLVPVEFEIGRQAASEGVKPLQQVLTARFARDGEFPRVGDMDFDLVAFLKLQRFDHRGGNPNRQTVAPFGDLHHPLSFHGYTSPAMYIPSGPSSRATPISPQGTPPAPHRSPQAPSRPPPPRPAPASARPPANTPKVLWQRSAPPAEPPSPRRRCPECGPARRRSAVATAPARARPATTGVARPSASGRSPASAAARRTTATPAP